jgi:hypothetical protein
MSIINKGFSFNGRMALFAASGCHLATWNVRCKLGGPSGKLEALVSWARGKQLLLVGLQETYGGGLEVMTVADADQHQWTLCVAGTASGRKDNGVGFLLATQVALVAFKADLGQSAGGQQRPSAHSGERPCTHREQQRRAGRALLPSPRGHDPQAPA